jgi:hypothetical protein
MAKGNRLNAAQLKTLTAPGRHPDGNGLYLQVRGPTNRSWILKFMIAENLTRWVSGLRLTLASP